MTDNKDTDTIDALTDQIDKLIETIEEQQERIEELERRVEDDEGDDETDPSELIDVRSDGDTAGLMDVWIAGIPMGKLLHRALERLNNVEEDVEAIEEDGSEAEKDRSTMHDLLPIDRIALENEVEDCTMGNVTASVERAAAIYENFRQWSSKTPRGRTIRTSTDGKGPSLKSLVATATDEDLSWKQVIRACKKLEEWSKGVIEFKKTNRQGWVLVAPDDITVGYGRPSSAGDQSGASAATA